MGFGYSKAASLGWYLCAMGNSQPLYMYITFSAALVLKWQTLASHPQPQNVAAKSTWHIGRSVTMLPIFTPTLPNSFKPPLWQPVS